MSKRLSPKLSDTPCPICGKEQLVATDGKTWCVHGGHALERELGIRRSPPAKQGDG